MWNFINCRKKLNCSGDCVKVTLCQCPSFYRIYLYKKTVKIVNTCVWYWFWSTVADFGVKSPLSRKCDQIILSFSASCSFYAYNYMKTKNLCKVMRTLIMLGQSCKIKNRFCNKGEWYFFLIERFTIYFGLFKVQRRQGKKTWKLSFYFVENEIYCL